MEARKPARLDVEGYELEDGEERQRAYPATFELPSVLERQSLQAGQIVKLIFRIRVAGDADDEIFTERMWVKIVGCSNGAYVGELANHPDCTDDMTPGMIVPFEPRHVIDIYETER